MEELVFTWQLYSGMSGVEDAARAIEEEYQKQIASSNKWRQIRDHMMGFMEQYENFGACDTEPECILCDRIEKDLELPRGTVPRW